MKTTHISHLILIKFAPFLCKTTFWAPRGFGSVKKSLDLYLCYTKVPFQVWEERGKKMFHDCCMYAFMIWHILPNTQHTLASSAITLPKLNSSWTSSKEAFHFHLFHSALFFFWASWICNLFLSLLFNN